MKEFIDLIERLPEGTAITIVTHTDRIDVTLQQKIGGAGVWQQRTVYSKDMILYSAVPEAIFDEQINMFNNR